MKAAGRTLTSSELFDGLFEANRVLHLDLVEIYVRLDNDVELRVDAVEASVDRVVLVAEESEEAMITKFVKFVKELAETGKGEAKRKAQLFLEGMEEA